MNTQKNQQKSAKNEIVQKFQVIILTEHGISMVFFWRKKERQKKIELRIRNTIIERDFPCNDFIFEIIKRLTDVMYNSHRAMSTYLIKRKFVQIWKLRAKPLSAFNRKWSIEKNGAEKYVEKKKTSRKKIWQLVGNCLIFWMKHFIEAQQLCASVRFK